MWEEEYRLLRPLLVKTRPYWKKQMSSIFIWHALYSRIPVIYTDNVFSSLSHPLVVCSRAHVLFRLFVFACEYRCSTHIVLCFCFVFLRLVYPMLPVSLVCTFLIVPSVFSNVYIRNISWSHTVLWVLTWVDRIQFTNILPTHFKTHNTVWLSWIISILVCLTAQTR